MLSLHWELIHIPNYDLQALYRVLILADLSNVNSCFAPGSTICEPRWPFYSLGQTVPLFFRPFESAFLLREWPAQVFQMNIFLLSSVLCHVFKGLLSTSSLGAGTLEFLSTPCLTSVTCLSLSKMIVFKYLLTYWLVTCSTSPPLRFAMPFWIWACWNI